MQKFNKDDIGQTLYVDFNQDISTQTAISIKLNPQSGDELTKTGTLGTSDVWVEDQKMLANQYATYTVEDGVFDDWSDDAKWQYKGIATLTSTTVATDYRDFTVMS
jgi:hypothetical protein